MSAFQDRVRELPDAAAVVLGGRSLTYDELDVRSSALAHHLSRQGVQAGDMVGLCTARSLEMVVGLLAILKTGATYVPLDARNPVKRLTATIRDAKLAALLLDRRTWPQLTHSGGVPCVDVDSVTPDERCSAGFEPVRTEDLQSAYMVYTSGSTGRPKGVLVHHRAVLQTVRDTDYIDIRPGDRVAQAGTLSFDISVFEIWGALLNGATLVLVPESTVLDPDELAAAIRRHEVGVMVLASALFASIADARPDAFRPLKTLLFGGEAANPQAVRKVLAAGGPRRLINVYGPTECTVFATWHLIEDLPVEARSVPIGTPISRTTAYVLDENLAPALDGAVGELYLGGPRLAIGYHDRDELTRERFIRNPFQDGAGGRLYKTGDLVRQLPDGTFDFVGRVDHQIKIRGFRVELGEIEAALQQHDAVKAAVAVARRDATGNQQIVAYVATDDSSLAPAVLKGFLHELLPDYMVPAFVVTLDSLPLNVNGKVDRAALPEPDCDSPAGRASAATPATPLEVELSAIWSEVLGVSPIGVEESFVELGGHSLMAPLLMTLVDRRLHRKLPVATVYEHPTVREMARVVEATPPRLDPLPAEGATVGDSTAGGATALLRSRPLVAHGASDGALPSIPLSPGQEQMWILHQMTPEGPIYNECLTFDIHEALNSTAFEVSLAKLVQRHECLRTMFPAVDGRPQQEIQDRAAPNLIFADHRGLPDSQRGLESEALVARHLREPFDLERCPLFRVVLVALGDNEYRVSFIVHHIVVDAISLDVILSDLEILYRYETGESAEDLPSLELQYADYAQWRRQWCEQEDVELARQVSYWERQLDGLPEVRLPRSNPTPETSHKNAGARRDVELSTELTRRLEGVARAANVSLFTVLTAALQILLQRYSGDDDVAIGAVTSQRDRPELLGVVGYFLNTLILRSDLSGDPTFDDLLGRVHQVILSAHEHQDVPFATVADGWRHGQDGSPIQVMFAYQPPATENPGSWSRSPQSPHSGTAKFDLTITLGERDDRLTGAIEYRTGLFTEATIQRFVEHLTNLLGEIVADSGRSISRFDVLSAAERRQLLAEWSGRGKTVDSDFACVHHRFEAWVEQDPEAIALSFGEQRLSYRELNERANRLAHFLIQAGVETDTLVGLACARSPRVVIGILGILKAGGAYLPLDPIYPAERMQCIVDDAQPRLVLTESALCHRFEAYSGDVVRLDMDWDEMAGFPATNPGVEIGSDHLIYSIYTSGSTGKPKGVLITHGNVAHLFTSTRSLYDFDRNDVWTLFHSFAFDFSVWEIWGALIHGGRLVVVPQSVSRDPEAFWTLLQREEVTVLNQTPSAFYQLIHSQGVVAGDVTESSLRYIVFGGEVLDFGKLKPWFERYGDCRPQLVNMYGITETTVHTTHRPLSIRDVDGAASAIGRALPNLEAYVLDAHRRPVPIGAIGELYVGGAGVARGYLDRPELTRERFIANPFDVDGGRLYKTGDLVRFSSDGELEYLGRVDNQVKIRGFRIELGDIESALGTLPGIRQALVLARQMSPGDNRLVAYVVAKAGQEPDFREVRAALARSLPEYMIPAFFVTLDSLPLTPNGKLDRRALPSPELERRREHVVPATEVERITASTLAEVLSLDAIGTDERFFDLGANSLLAVQVAAKLGKELGVNVPVHFIFEYDSVAELSRALQPLIEDRSELVDLRVAHLAEEAELDPEIRPVGEPDPARVHSPDGVFLTGATGLLGAFLLRDLLMKTGAEVYCLVRAATTAAGNERLRVNLETYGLWEEDFRARIVAVPGDLSRPLLGLSEDAFADLSRRIDVIYHSGALVNFVMPYSFIKGANVDGTREVLRLACKSKPKVLHHISTVSVSGPIHFFDRSLGVLGEDFDTRRCAEHLYMGYTQSKWVAERLVMEAQARGLQGTIIRTGFMTGGALTGASNVKDFVCRMIKGCIQLGAYPDLREEKDYIPVDFASEAILHMTRQPQSSGKVFQLVAERRFKYRELFRMIRDYGYSFDELNLEDWTRRLASHCETHAGNPLEPLLPLFTEPVHDGLSLAHLYEENLGYDRTNVREALVGSSIECPPLDFDLVSRYLSYFVRVGFLPSPPCGA